MYGDLGGPWGVAYANDKIYFTQDNDSRLHSMNEDGSSSVELGSGTTIGTPRAIQVYNGMLYWITSGSGIKRSNLDGTGVVTLNSTPNANQGIFVNSQYIYYTYSFGEKSVSRMDLDGGNQIDLITGGDLSIPYGILATDTALFWVDLGAGTLSTSGLDGSNVTILLSGLSRPTGLTLYNDQFYITEGNWRLLKCDLDGGNLTELANNLRDARFLAIVSAPDDSGGSTWAGYPVELDGVQNEWANTGSWLGYLSIKFAPWIFILDTGTWAYMVEPGPTDPGVWAFMLR
jgi:hypothetical protein|tara:strand:- start:1369 stop:2232 length:864 start_codon:yes stop_codon:yes gene_type:complete